MSRYAAFLGSINVGGHRVTMERLRKEFESLGFADVSTFIASGNVSFVGRGKVEALEAKIEANLSKKLGFPVAAFLREAAAVVDIAARLPFGEELAGYSHYVGLLRSTPSAADKTTTQALSNERDTFVVRGTELHWRIHGKSLDTSVKPAVLAKAIQQPMTTRNVTSLRRFASLLER